MLAGLGFMLTIVASAFLDGEAFVPAMIVEVVAAAMLVISAVMRRERV